MKTIRNNVFETNSSSTHSITIIQQTLNNLVDENNILHPENLTYDYNKVIKANTKNRKAALFCHYFADIISNKDNLSEIFKILSNDLGYNEININFESSFSPFDDDDWFNFDQMNIDKVIKIILDDNLSILDVNKEW